MTTTHTLPTCPRCERTIAPDAPSGLCPKCLVDGALHSALGNSLTDSRPSPRMDVPSVAEVGALLPSLEVIEELGRGGMGVVYLARQPGLDRPVAVKLLPREIGEDVAFAERFAREARSLAKLSHPNIVAIHDSGTAGDYCWFVMEYVDGSNLRGLLQSGALTASEALELIPQICAGLQYAHDTGIIHRDIKPENILVTEDGRVKIADFGLAKLLGPDSRDATLTLTNQVMGTPHYMAPEQLQRGSAAVDHRADIYALGVVLYELLTGRLPIGRFAPPSQVAKTDPALDGVVLRCLDAVPERRFQHVKDVLEAMASGAPIPVHAAETTVLPARSAAEERAAVLQLLEGPPQSQWRPAHYVAAIPTLGLVPAMRAETILIEHCARNAVDLAEEDMGDDPERTKFQAAAIEATRASAWRRRKGALITFLACVVLAIGGAIGYGYNEANRYQTTTVYRTKSVYSQLKNRWITQEIPIRERHRRPGHRDMRDITSGIMIAGGVIWILALLTLQVLHGLAVSRHERAQLSVDILDRNLNAQRTEIALEAHKYRWLNHAGLTVLGMAMAIFAGVMSLGLLFLLWGVLYYRFTLRRHEDQEAAGLYVPIGHPHFPRATAMEMGRQIASERSARGGS